MVCPECDTPNAVDHNYCKNCGFPLRAHHPDHDLQAGSAERARDRCLAILKHDPANADGHFNLGLASYHLGHVEDAIVAFQRAVSLDETLAHAHFQLSVCYYRRGLFDDCALAVDRRCSTIHPRSLLAIGSPSLCFTSGGSTKPCRRFMKC